MIDKYNRAAYGKVASVPNCRSNTSEVYQNVAYKADIDSKLAEKPIKASVIGTLPDIIVLPQVFRIFSGAISIVDSKPTLGNWRNLLPHWLTRQNSMLQDDKLMHDQLEKLTALGVYNFAEQMTEAYMV